MRSFGNIPEENPNLNTIERFYIHKEAASNTHLNEEHKISHNQVFETILNILSKQ